jgi:hypothetical protein
MSHRNLASSHPDLERRRVPLAMCLVAGLALVNVLVTALSLVAGSAGPLLR